MKRLTIMLTGLLVLIAVGLNAQEPVTFRKDRLFAKEPIVTGFEGASAIVEFETLVPTPGAIAYYGVYLLEGELAVARYRREATESLPEGKTLTTTHHIEMNISGLESVHYDTGLIENGGGVIVYRIEVFDPRISASRLYDYSFRYKRDGEPKSGEYTKLVSLVEGPFVDLVTDDAVVISWETDLPMQGAVLLDDRYLPSDTATIASSQVATRHEVRIDGLRPDTQYTYRVRYASDGGITQVYSFRTAPAPGSQRPFRFGFMSDSRGGVGGGERAQNGVNTKDLSQFARDLYNRGADLICFGGDLINGYTSDFQDYQSQLDTWKQAVQPVGARIPIYECMGNHEQVGDYFKVADPEKEGEHLLLFAGRSGETSAEAGFAAEFVNPPGSVYDFSAPQPEKRAPGLGGAETGPTHAENVYSFNYGNVHFVALNSNYWFSGLKEWEHSSRKYADLTGNNIALERFGGNREGYMRPNQLEWLERDLQAAQSDRNIDWIFIYLHEPPFPNGGHVRDAMYWGTPGKGELGGYNDLEAPLGDVIDMRDRFWTTVARYDKVLAVLCGDEHNYSRTRIDANALYPSPVWQITSGGCGAPFYVQDKSVPWVDNVEAFAVSKHYCLFTVRGKQITLEVYGDTGQLLDYVDELAWVK